MNQFNDEIEALKFEYKLMGIQEKELTPKNNPYIKFMNHIELIINTRQEKELTLRFFDAEYLPINSLIKIQPEILNIFSGKLRALPEIIYQLSKLTSLSIHRSELIELPNGFCKLQNLKSLLIDGKLEKLPARFGDLKKLNYLQLADNNLSFLPHSMKELTSLENLDLSNNNLGSFNMFYELRNLKSLNLKGNNIFEISNDIKKLDNLVNLDLRGNNIQSLPLALTEMINLQILDLRDNKGIKVEKDIAEGLADKIILR